jgi:glycosyltransferase involved in cell wall biosynthesis
MPANMEDHTFVIPVYKESPYLEECIQKLLGQTVGSKVVMATSTPSAFAKAIAETYRIPYFIDDSGQTGIANDWNFALSKATTQFVTIAHQDDIYEAKYTEILLSEIKAGNHHDVLMAFTSYTDLVNDQERKFSLNALVKSSLLFPFFFSRAIQSSFFKKLILLFGDPICCPSVTLNMAALGTFKFSTDYQCALDWYAWYQLAKKPGAFIYVNKKLIRHRIHIDSETTNQLNNGIRKQEELRMFELMWGKGFSTIISKIYAIGHKDNLL